MLQAEVAGMRQHAGIEVGQERRTEGGGIRRMDTMLRKMRPGVDFNKELGERHTGQALGDPVGQDRGARVASADLRLVHRGV